MKIKTLISFIIIIFCVTLYGQEEMKTLFGKSSVSPVWGHYLSGDIKITQFIGDFQPYVGVKGALIVNHKYAFGFTGGGFTEPNTFTGPGYEGSITDIQPVAAYGGLYLDYFIYLNSPVMISFPTTVGVGGILLFQDDINPVLQTSEKRFIEGTPCFVIEPSINADINLLKSLRLGLGIGYRLVSGVDLNRLDNSDFSGLMFNISLNAGLF